MKEKSVNIPLFEANPGDVRLAQKLIKESKLHNNLHVAKDGDEAMAFLRQEGDRAGKPWPALSLFDINLPKKDGRVVGIGERITTSPEDSETDINKVSFVIDK